jgi:collagen type III alpha
MPAVVESPPVARIDRHLAHAAGRIRATDVLTGILAIVAMTLCYAAVMILIDRTYTLPGWVRQLGLLGWLGLAGVTAYRLIVRPFGQNVNPLYVAKQVESAIPDAKNVVVNYVDLKDKNLPTTVRDAVAGRASAEVTESDVQKAGESRKLVTLGVASAVLAVVLAVMFLVFSPAQFMSLAKRTFRPFAATEIVSKTRLSITFPSDPNLTVTTGQPVVLQVAVDGRLPSTDGDDRVRLLLRHNNEDPNYEAIPFEPGGTNREFQLRVPEHLVQNGFWYKVAGGDGETPEYRVTVRLRPLVLGVSVMYEYPEYLRMPKETIDRPHIEAYRGTKITVAAKTNRPLQSGRLTFDGKPDVNLGTVSPDDTESIRFQFTVGESGTYRLYFTATDGESSLDPPAYPVKVIVDNPPTVVIAKPEPEEIPLPANGQLAIDAIANDDIGLSKLTIQLRKGGPQPLPLAGKPYALQLKREDDKSFPTQVEMKDSVALAELKTETGQPVSLAEGDIIEYWIEAVDNCEVPTPQTGKSAMKRVKILPPEVKPEQKQEMEKKAEARKNEEKKQQDQQKQKFEKEQRPPPPGQKEKGEKGEEQPGEKQPGEQQPGEKQPGEKQPGEKQPGEKQPGEQQPGEKQPGEKQPGEKQPGEQQPGEKQPGEKQPGEKQPGEKQPGEKQPGEQQPGEKQPGEKQPGEQQPMPGGTGEPTPEKKAKNEEIQNKAEQIAKEIEKQKQQSEGGSGQQQQPMAEPKAGDESQGGAKPQAPPEGAGTQQKPNDTKPDPNNPEKGQPGGEAKPGQSDSKTGESKPGAEAGTSKPMGGESKPQSGNTGQKPTPEQIKEMAEAAKDLNSSDPQKQQAARDKLDNMMGKENREKAEKLAKDLQSNDPKTRENAEKQMKEMANQMAQAGQDQKNQNPQQVGGGQKPTPQQQKEIADAARDLNSDDPAKREAAEKKLDQMVGKDVRQQAQKEAEKLKNDLNSKDPATKSAAEKKMKEMADQMTKAAQDQNNQKPQQGGTGQKPTPEQMKDFADAARDLNSNDPDKKKAAEQKLDNMIGKDARQQAQKEAEKLKNDLNSKDPATKEAAEKKLKDMADQMAKAGGDQKPQQQPGNAGQKPTPHQQKEMADAARDLNSDDPAKRQAAEKKLDEMIGKDAREQAQKDAKQLKDDLNSKDPATKAAAEKKLKDMADQMAKAGGEGKPQLGEAGSKQTPEQQAENEKAMKDLASDDAEAKKKAQDTLDKNIGEQKRKEAEKHVSDSKSNNPMVRSDAEKKLDELAGKGKEEQGQPGGEAKAGQPEQKGMSPEEAQKLAEKAKDLASKDEQKRKDAEKELDSKIGKENREKLQQTMNDLNSGDPKKMEEAQKQIEDWKKQAQEQGGKPNENWRPGGVGGGRPGGDPLKDNPADRLKAHELTLKTLKDAMKDKKQIEKLGYTQEEYERFVKGFEEMVKIERKAIEVTAKSNPNATPPKSINVNQGPDKLGVRGPEGTGPQGSSAGTAPPGYSEASRKFGEAAAKKKPKGEGEK